MIENGLNYSDSRSATKEEFTANLSAFEIKNPDAVSRGGPVLFSENGLAYTDSSELHDVIIGGTGSGKTLRFSLPLIYSSALAGESMVVVDPKGELYRKATKFLKGKGYELSCLNWRTPRKSPDQWNPFSRVNALYRLGSNGREDAMNALNDTHENMFNRRSSADKDIYWNESAGRLGLGLSKLILKSGRELSVKTLLEWKNYYLKDGTVERLFNSLSPQSDIYQNLSGYINLTATNTKTCIESTFDQLTGVFSASVALQEMMSNDTVNMNNIGTSKRAIFLIVPDEKTTYHFLATLFIHQCYEVLIEQAEHYDGRLPMRVNFILEEFCNMPKLNDLSSMLTAARSRNIRFHLIIQSYSQLIDKYGVNISRTIMDNCGNLIYLHTTEMEFLEYISSLAGTNEYGRPLISTSRLQHLQHNETLIFHDRCYPYLVQDLPMIFEYPMDQEEEAELETYPVRRLFRKNCRTAI